MPLLIDIQERLNSVRRFLLRVEMRSNFLKFIALMAGFAASLILAESLFHFNSAVRTILFILFVITVVVSVSWLVIRPALRLAGLLNVPSDFRVANLVGDAFSQVRDRLLNLLQLREVQGRGTLYSVDLIDAAFQDLAGIIAPIDFAAAVDPAPARRAAKIAIVVFSGLLVLFAVAPFSSADAAHRLVHFSRDFVPPAQYTFEVRPGNAEIVKGESVDVTVRVIPVLSQRLPSEPLTLFWKPRGQSDFESQQLWADSGSRFQTTLDGLRSSTEYFAQFADAQSNRFMVTIMDRPVIRAFQLRLTFPAYTRLPVRILDEFVGNVTAVAGTQVKLEGTASKELKQGVLAFGESVRKPLHIRGTRFSAEFTMKADSQYRVILADHDGLENPDPILYDLRVLTDEYPRISLLEPGKNVDVAGTTSLPMLMLIGDDFGFSGLRLAHRLIHSRYERPSETYHFTQIPFSSPHTTQAEIPYTWNFSPLGLVPEDVVEYFVEVSDNDEVSGPKRARSNLFLLRLPSLEEVFTDLDRSHEETFENLKETAEEAKNLKEKIESINEDFKKNKEIDWQQQKQMEETAKKYQDLQKKLEDVQSRLENMTQQMQEQNVLSTETLEKYLELQQLFEELSSTELQRALQKMQEAMQNVNKEQLRRALEQITFSEERFRQSIERAMDLLKRIQIEQKLDEARKRAEELAALQKELNEATDSMSTEAPDKSNELSRKELDLKKKLDRLKKSMQDVQNRMEEFFTEMPEEEMQSALERLDSMGTSALMEQASKELQSRQVQQAQQTQRQIQGGLEQLSSDLSQIQSQMLQQQQEDIVNELRRATRDLLELSRREEQLKAQSAGAPSNSPQLRQNAQDQMRVLQDLQNLISSLQELSKRSFAVTPGMGRALGEAMVGMRSALNALDTRSGGQATQQQLQAMESLNKAAMEVQRSLQSMQQAGGSGGGLMGQLQQMAGQQMSLNQRTQSLEDAARLAAEQQALQKSLEQLNAEARAAGEQERILGDLERITEEMREVVRDLDQGNVEPETIRRQERILSRLLDAARSTREQDFEKKRKAQTGRQIVRPGPDELDPATLEGRNRLREDLLRALEQGYSRDYQELIRRYFEQLQKAETR